MHFYEMANRQREGACQPSSDCTVVSLVGVGVWLLLFFCSRVVALASICFALSLPISAYFFYAAAQIYDIRFILCTVLAVLITLRHHGNIRRLVQGNENRFSK